VASLNAIKLDADQKQYYEREVADGKNKMTVLDAAKNKLSARVIAANEDW
jgi:transposase